MRGLQHQNRPEVQDTECVHGEKNVIMAVIVFLLTARVIPGTGWWRGSIMAQQDFVQSLAVFDDADVLMINIG